MTQRIIADAASGRVTVLLSGPQGPPGSGGTGGGNLENDIVVPYIVTDPTDARPDVPTGSIVMWIGGTVQPQNMATNDVWFADGPVSAPTAPVITTTSLTSLSVGAEFSQTLLATGTPTVTWSTIVGSVPAGLSLSTAGELTGTPTTQGAYSFTVQATNAQGSDTHQFTGTVAATPVAPTITTGALGAMEVAVAFSELVEASGDTPITFTISAGALPAGLTLSTAGLVSGTPTTDGAYDFTVQATNAVGSDTEQFTGTVAAESGATLLNVLSDPPSTSGAGWVVATDGGGTLWYASQFYATIPIRVHGCRIWAPSGASSGHRQLEVTAYGIPRDWLGSSSNFDPNYPIDIVNDNASTGVITDLRDEDSWADILFDTTFDLAAIDSGSGDADCVLIAVSYEDGNDYVYITEADFGGTSAVEAPGEDVYLAEASFTRSINSFANSSGGSALVYNIDLIYEEL